MATKVKENSQPAQREHFDQAQHKHFDVLIIGAGISGIGAACYLKRELPGKSYAILERRQAIGGTWDLFRYPGIRSDSDMNTFGFGFRPWTETRVLSDGPSIKKYVEDTAKEYDVTRHIRFGTRVTSAKFSSKDATWTLETQSETGGAAATYTANFIIACTGYYNYDKGYQPEFPGEKSFKGQLIHPQKWPENLDYAGKKVVVIGSGATAVTLLPAMADKTAHITMLQRSPTYIVSIPSNDFLSQTLRRFLPKSWVYQMARVRNIALQRLIFMLAKARPDAIRRLILGGAKRELGDAVDIKHFSPKYNPWDERLCVVPDGDLFKTLKSGKASVVTDQIETFTETGIKLKSGNELEADIVVSATGLNVELMGGVEVEVDGAKVPVTQRVTYKAVLVEGVPNAAIIFGYTNASWTLKVDIACEYICRLLKHMDKNHQRVVVARAKDEVKTADTVMGGLNSGYIRRAIDKLPRQGTHGVWKVSNDYISDSAMLKFSPIADEALEFS
ncbi:flavin-containing monooxygenase [Turneriella parva]|uniref:FAD dependent oxidoreductase n=1 Tax=Turneriella parva (strain ATCC BAA-1111 / DSM 21527 / NCTC 11395 / H) TaxID=869212 RepID=I4B2G5_TURPD|nr:NAD(P)/FAD-dependent oxidoreductase [Turneriella parva]AFM11472.1 FAD dependent oxidoreductase [Turneriella parva DSM 21527]